MLKVNKFLVGVVTAAFLLVAIILNPKSAPSTSSTMTTVYPGDNIIPDAAMIYDRTRLIKAKPEEIWPWVVQLGKGRGGWYLATFWERLLPKGWPASRSVEKQWQGLKVGDRVPDYGKDEYFDVVSIDPPRSLVYTSERFGTVFTWTLLLHPRGSDETELHLRFRGRIQSTGLKRRVLIFGGDVLDWATTAPMLAGLAERAEHVHMQ